MSLNFYSSSFLNRCSWLRQDLDYLHSALKSDNSRFLILNNLQPLLVSKNPSADKKPSEGELILALLKYDDVREYLPQEPFSAEPTTEASTSPPLVFLGIDERTATAFPDASKPSGLSYFSLDASNLPQLVTAAQSSHPTSSFVEMRAGILSVEFETAGVIAEARALTDWHVRNRYCAGCGKRTAPVWGGWKRQCIKTEQTDAEKPPCISSKGVHNFAYPRTDPVVIMAVQNHDKSSLLLGRQKAWPAGFHSCLAGFVESGESLEEAVRREVWEEAGVSVEAVEYHSSQPWPFPSSLMLGCLATASKDATIRLDLDNELEDARWITKSELRHILAGPDSGLSRAEVEKMDAQEAAAKTSTDRIRLPPKTAIAHTLIRAWVEE